MLTDKNVSDQRCYRFFLKKLRNQLDPVTTTSQCGKKNWSQIFPILVSILLQVLFLLGTSGHVVILLKEFVIFSKMLILMCWA